VRTYQIKVNGKEYEVEIDDLNASPVSVLVNGQAFEVVVSEQQASVQAVRRPDRGAELEEAFVPTVTSTFVETAVEPQREAASTPQAAPAASGNLREVTAPMPGKILDIAVQPGTAIKTGDTLCNLEAMKMKSPIRSTADGTIAQVLISEGQNVNFGDVLFTVQ
jgi:biotin carboxyl carrier protein